MTIHPLRHALPDPLGFAAEALARAAAGRRTGGAELLVRVVLPAPAAGVEALLERLPDQDGFAWATADGDLFAGSGTAWQLQPSGRDRFAAAAAAAAALWPRLAEQVHPATSAPPARMLAAFAFAPGAAGGPPWTGFGDGLLQLPRWSYGRGATGPWLALTVTATEAATPALWLEGLERVARALAEPSPRSRGEGWVGGGPLTIDDTDAPAFIDRVAAIRRAIVARRCEKIVAARAVALGFPAPPSPAEILRRLHAAHPGCTRFAVRRGGAVFLGATPERLLSVRGLTVSTEALAGSQTSATALLASAKDRGEHDLVVRAIIDALGPFCRELAVAGAPVAHALRHLVHLRTPITGRLHRPTPVLELAGALHPTPAVGGVPAGPAQAWIATSEPVPRGWYAGPIGWIDAAGDGELAVALRSGLLRGASAWLWAGAGIVRDSDPDTELAETRLKLGALVDALGAGR